jgi:hypothetical protein
VSFRATGGLFWGKALKMNMQAKPARIILFIGLVSGVSNVIK